LLSFECFDFARCDGTQDWCAAALSNPTRRPQTACSNEIVAPTGTAVAADRCSASRKSGVQALDLSDEGKRKSCTVTRDTEYFHRRAAEARAAAYAKDEPQQAEIAGELALAYAALARRRARAVATADEAPAIPLEQPA
jgi:hypothetical protein